LAKHAASNNKPFAMNISAEYICFVFLERLNSLLPYVDVLFGNEQEARAYAKSNGFEECEDLAKIAMKMAQIQKVKFKNTYNKKFEI
jgi:adenosine kinase